MMINSNCLFMAAFALIFFYAICSAAWLVTVRKAVTQFLNKMDCVVDGMKSFCESEDAKIYAQRLKQMSDEELEREITNGRLVNSWGKEIATTVEGLRASVPFLGRR